MRAVWPFQNEINAHLDGFDAFSEEREILSTALLGESETFKIDKDGRIVLSDIIKASAGITDTVVFVGQGFKFRMWQPDHYETYRKEAQKRTLAMLRQKKPGTDARQQGGDA